MALICPSVHVRRALVAYQRMAQRVARYTVPDVGLNLYLWVYVECGVCNECRDFVE